MWYDFKNKLKHTFDIFKNGTNWSGNKYEQLGYSYARRPTMFHISRGGEKNIISAIVNRIGIDVSNVDIKHVRLDDNDRFVETINSNLNNCLSLEANIDQTGRAFIRDIVMSLLDEGCVAIIPTVTDNDITDDGTLTIYEMRVAKIVTWHPRHVEVSIFNDITGFHENIVLPKSKIAIIENPLYTVMNQSNSTLQRLNQKLNMLDILDQKATSGKLDLIIQLPYIIKTDAKREQAEKRRADIENQLYNGKYGIAYIDGSERVTQLNRPVENNLMTQVEYLTNMVFAQLGMTQSILDGTASETEMINYNGRTVEPILTTITDEFTRKFLTKTARTQKQRITYISNPFKLASVSQMADIADKYTRNEILSPNEIRQLIGMKPSSSPEADELRNRNISQPNDVVNNRKDDTHEEKI